MIFAICYIVGGLITTVLAIKHFDLISDGYLNLSKEDIVVLPLIYIFWPYSLFLMFIYSDDSPVIKIRLWKK